MTGIEWTNETWNPTTGCDKVSDGCTNCYALTMAKRLKGMGQAKYQRDGDPRTSGSGFGITEHADALAAPLSWRKPRKVFVNSMSDLFHAGVSDEFIARVFAVMAATPQHTYQVLTKRHGRMRSLLSNTAFRLDVMRRAANLDEPFRRSPMWPIHNVVLGVSAEDQQRADLRVPALITTPAAVRFVSAEPLIGPLRLARDWADLDWMIVGGESGSGARPLDTAWVESLIGDCRDLGVAPFVKQMGSCWARDTSYAGVTVAKTDPKGGDPQHWPPALRVREFPADVAVTA